MQLQFQAFKTPFMQSKIKLLHTCCKQMILILNLSMYLLKKIDITFKFKLKFEFQFEFKLQFRVEALNYADYI